MSGTERDDRHAADVASVNDASEPTVSSEVSLCGVELSCCAETVN